MIEKLRQATEVAIDLEYHNYRSFAGFVCLMQISTSAEDFIIDTLELREELEDLNEVFTDPCIVKVRPYLGRVAVAWTEHRSFTERRVISFGYSKTSTCT